MKEREDYLKDLGDIRDMMERSSRFISLSGASGVLVGLYALAAYYMVRFVLPRSFWDFDGTFKTDAQIEYVIQGYLLVGITTLVLSVGTAIFLTVQNAKRNGQGIWDGTAKRLVAAMLVPLIIGGFACLTLLLNGSVGLIAPLTLIFYGLALINASKYSLPELYSLGVAEAVLGLIALWLIGFGLHFWAVGFGLLHIVYGVAMHLKYKQ